MKTDALLELIRRVISTAEDSKLRKSTAENQVNQVLQAGDAASRRMAATLFLATTAIHENPARENAYRNLLVWRQQPPNSGGILNRASWLSKSENDRLEKAIQARDWNEAENILALEPITKLRVLVRRLLESRLSSDESGAK